MGLTKSQYVMIGAVIIAIIAIAAGCLYFLGSDSKKDTKAIATNFAENYDGVFGPFVLGKDSTSVESVVEKETGSTRMEFSRIYYTATNDAKAEFDKIKADNIDTLAATLMGAALTEVTGIKGFDGISAYKYNVAMGAANMFTMMYFVAYVDGVLIDGSENAMYYGTGHATSAEITALFSAISAAI